MVENFVTTAPPQSGLVIADPLIGAVVADRYRIERLIGRGGMGVVYQVEHTKIGKVMALKLLTGELARNPDTVRRFKREALLVSKLSHPNTVQVFDYGSVGGLTYLAMEYLNGQDLGELVDTEGPRPFSQLAKMLVQVCGALAEAHAKGMVHRDLKPENLFLTRTPSGAELVKVLDFGLAKLRDSRELGQITSTGNIVGTPYYMPPEQVRGEEVDPRGDVYALCAVLYTCLTGHHVFEAPSPIAVLSQQLSGEVIPPHERAPELEISESVSALVVKGLNKDPAGRFQSVQELEQALKSELQGSSYTRLSLPSTGAFARRAEQSSVTRNEVERYERGLRRRELVAKAVTALVLLGLLGGAVRLYWQTTRPKTFDGREVEPNHEVSTATPIPFGALVRGRLGQRIAPTRGDQDNFSVVIPRSPRMDRTRVRLSLSELSNMGLCLWVFRDRSEKPLHRFCSGAPGRGLDIPDLALRPGEYLFVVKQDVQEVEQGRPTYLIENVSENYELEVSPREPSRGAESTDESEVESNDSPSFVRDASPQTILAPPLAGRDVGPSAVLGSFAWTGDVDVVCARGEGLGRFVVTDAEGGVRPLDSALRLTPLGGPEHKIPVRLHGGRGGIPENERDIPGPWFGPWTELSASPCVQLELTPNPFAPTPHPIVPPLSDHLWRVELETKPSSPDQD